MLPEAVLPIWNVIRAVQLTWGFTVGLYLFTSGPYLFEHFGGNQNSANAMLLTSIWLTTGILLEGILEVPTGAIADAVGRKRTVLWSFLCRAVFFLLMAITGITHNVIAAFCIAILANIVFAFCYTFFSGIFTAWCVDSIRQKAPDLGYEHLLARGYMYQFLAQIAGCVVGIWCFSQHIAYVAYLCGAAVCIPCFSYCSGVMEETYTTFLPHKIRAVEITRRIGEIIGLAFTTFRKSKPILCLTILFASYLFLDNVINYYWPLALKTQVDTAQYTGYWLGLSAVAISICALGSKQVSFMSRSWASRSKDAKTQNGILRRWLIGSALACSLPVLGMGFLRLVDGHSLPLFLTSIIMVSFAYGMMLPCYETLVNNYIPEASSKERATILSYSSMVRAVILTLLGIPTAGHSADSSAIGWMIPAALLTVMAGVTWLVLSSHERANLKAVELIQGGPQ